MNPSHHSAEEIQKFDELAHSWWDSTGPLKTLHQINPARLDFIQMHCELRQKKILDVGCGGGILTESMAKLGAVVTGIDMAESVIDVAKIHSNLSELSIHYECTDVENFSEKHPQQFDVITCMELLEHVPHPEQIISACAKLIKPEGLIFFSTLNRTFKAFSLAIIGAEYLLKLLPAGTHDYEKFIKPSELDAWCRNAQLQLKALSGLRYNPITQHASLHRDVSVNYLACYQAHT